MDLTYYGSSKWIPGPKTSFLGQLYQPYWQYRKDLTFSICLYSKRGNQIKLHTTKRGNQIKSHKLFPDLL